MSYRDRDRLTDIQVFDTSHAVVQANVDHDLEELGRAVDRLTETRRSSGPEPSP